MTKRDHPQMTPEEREDLLADPHVAVLATVGADDGLPHLVPVWYAWDGKVFTLSLQAGSRKHRNLDERPQFTICVDKRTWPYRSAIADCDVASMQVQQGYPRELAVRYLDGERLEQLIDRYASIEWALVRGHPIRWYGHINRGG